MGLASSGTSEASVAGATGREEGRGTGEGVSGQAVCPVRGCWIQPLVREVSVAVESCLKIFPAAAGLRGIPSLGNGDLGGLYTVPKMAGDTKLPPWSSQHERALPTAPFPVEL